MDVKPCKCAKRREGCRWFLQLWTRGHPFRLPLPEPQCPHYALKRDALRAARRPEWEEHLYALPAHRFKQREESQGWTNRQGKARQGREGGKG